MYLLVNVTVDSAVDVFDTTPFPVTVLPVDVYVYPGTDQASTIAEAFEKILRSEGREHVSSDGRKKERPVGNQEKKNR